MKPLPWSYTALDDFVNCPKSYYEKRVAKSVKEERSQHMIWGEEVHKHFELRQKDGKPLPKDLAHHEPLMERLEKMPGKSWTERKIALDKKAQPCDFFAKDVWFRGVIDFTKLHEDKGLIVDYKTGKQHAKFQQITLFALWLFANHPELEIIEGRYYWTQTEKSTSKIYFRRMVPDLWAEFIPNLKQYAQAFKEDIWQPRQSGLCHGWCPVTTCEFWKPKRNK